MTATEVVAVPTTLLVDSRNTCLRATWHAADHVVVLSHWRDGACASTFQLANADVARLTSFLVDVLGESVTGFSDAATEHLDEGASHGVGPMIERARASVSNALGWARRSTRQP